MAEEAARTTDQCSRSIYLTRSLPLAPEPHRIPLRPITTGELELVGIEEADALGGDDHKPFPPRIGHLARIGKELESHLLRRCGIDSEISRAADSHSREDQEKSWMEEGGSFTLKLPSD